MSCKPNRISAASVRREWSDVAPAMESEPTLTGQNRVKEFEYRVLAINKAGEGESSDGVMAML